MLKTRNLNYSETKDPVVHKTFRTYLKVFFYKKHTSYMSLY